MRAAATWMVRNLATEALRLRAQNSRLVRYRDLVADPKATVRTILADVTGHRHALDFIRGREAELEPKEDEAKVVRSKQRKVSDEPE